MEIVYRFSNIRKHINISRSMFSSFQILFICIPRKKKIEIFMVLIIVKNGYDGQHITLILYFMCIVECLFLERKMSDSPAS